MNTAGTAPPRLYAPREPIFPRRVAGTFRTLKWWLLGILLAIYYVVPWIRWDRGEFLPDQGVLIDLAHRRFFFFWIEIWPHEFYFVGGLLIMAGLGLFLFTSIFGRVWCGYACPQTIWTDLFILVERMIEGDRNRRIRLWNGPMTLRKARLRLTKWTVWLAISVATGGAWIFYFADAPTLLVDFVTLSASPIAYTTVGILTATTFVFGGFLREQVCTYMCPWPRIQSAMMDEHSLTVTYRTWRGEPRGRHRKARVQETLGDCIDCHACVNVCPVGIDIRDGHQIECIGCALCIDACDDIMARIGKPRGLIDYMTLADERLQAEQSHLKDLARRLFRPRVALYTVLWSGMGLALLVALFLRPAIEFSISPVRSPLYVTLTDGSIRNSYELRIKNRHGEDAIFKVGLAEGSPFALRLEGSDDSTTVVQADQTGLRRMYVIAPPGSDEAAGGQFDIEVWIEDVGASTRGAKRTTFHGSGT
ncbi:MAG: cytochrome c oxidase accessory protein CcoG [Rhodobacteraceae bacterium]|nr:cytochrome c oxidase accessory protein CcoG [Paracoccaceae bacterium]